VSSGKQESDGVPRLLLYAGRTNGGLRTSLQRAATYADDAEFAALLNRSAYSSTKAQPYRGYALVSPSGHVVEIKVSVGLSLSLYVPSLAIFRADLSP